MSKDFQKTWGFFSEKDKKYNINFWLTNCKEHIKHKVNKLNVIKFCKDSYGVINEETLVCKFFDTEQECIDYCLDVYPNSFHNTQLNLFE